VAPAGGAYSCGPVGDPILMKDLKRGTLVGVSPRSVRSTL
jgi:hypothetical protein